MNKTGMIVIDEDEDMIDDCFLMQKKVPKKHHSKLKEEDVDLESEEKIKSKTTNLEGLLSKINGKNSIKKNK